MAAHENSLGQPVGAPEPAWEPSVSPPRTEMVGRSCRLEPLDAERHAAELHDAYREDRDGGNWTYLPYGPFASVSGYRAFVESIVSRDDPLFYAILVDERALGAASYMRMDPPNGSIEVGHLSYSPALQRTSAATEAMFLMMRRAFDELGYRRYEWKCDSLNAPSRAAAARLGFRYEGTFLQHAVMKGRNRDTSWFSITDREWPSRKAALEAWLDPANFDAAGRQRTSLLDLRST